MTGKDKKNISATIDGHTVTVPKGTIILEAARKANIHIPTLCDHHDLKRRAVCRVCVVECDGASKLSPACANEVWDGINVITHNSRISNVRKTIVELLLANHPQECLSCIRNKNCQLQSLAYQLGIRKSSFSQYIHNRRDPVIENRIFTRDMDKCVKCGCCIEACQEIQAVQAINYSHRSVNYEICSPYDIALNDGPCVFCGYCAAICPVGALYEYDQSSEIWAALRGQNGNLIAQIPSGKDIDNELGLPARTMTDGKIISALKRLGFNRVYDTVFFSRLAANEAENELLDRLNGNGKLPMIYSCIPNWIKKFYPDYLPNLYTGKNVLEQFGNFAKESNEMAVSISSCLVDKYAVQSETCKTDIALSIRELARMIRLAGIDLVSLAESSFDKAGNDLSAEKKRAPLNFAETETGVEEADFHINGKKIKIWSVGGLGNARRVMEAVCNGKCEASLIEIRNCTRPCHRRIY